MFETIPEDLKSIIRNVDAGSLQLPDFQRDYVWGDEDVRSLIASIAKGFPVGALLTLQTGGRVNFQPRLLAGVEPKSMDPRELLLDGQQRITSLYQSMFSAKSVRTRTHRGTEIERFYFLDIEKSVGGSVDLEDAIVGVPADKKLRSNFGRTVDLDVSTQDAEFEHDLFPLNNVFDNRNWFFDWRDYWRDRGRDVADLERSFVQGIIDAIDRYKMPIIRLSRDNSREAICLVFEKVNVGGKKLDAFELVTAIYAADNFDLRKDWRGSQDSDEPGRRARMVVSSNSRDVLSKIASTDFLQACTLLHTRENRLAKMSEGGREKDLPQITCRRSAMLGLSLTAYTKHADAVERGFVEASNFFNEVKIIRQKDVPYPPQLVALASTFAILDRDARPVAAKQKLQRWFWSVTLGELYGSSTDSQMARDVPELVEWISGSGDEPRALESAMFQLDRLRALRTRQSAAYKGLHALLMHEGCRDFITGRETDIMTFFNDQIDIHHIFPQAWCKSQGIDSKVYNSIINKTPLSRVTNNAIGARAPSVYLERIEQEHETSSAELDSILRTHLIDPELLRADDFEAFFEARAEALSSLVADAMGKRVVEEQGSNEEEVEVEPVEEELDEEEYREAV